MPAPSASPLVLDSAHRASLAPYLPPTRAPTTASIDPNIPTLPHLTLTYATSLDSQISLSPNVQTVLSGPESKAMTHYLRSMHDAILVGVGTAEADDPGLNCRFAESEDAPAVEMERQPRPLILDPRSRWTVSPTSKVVELAHHRVGKAPWWVTGDESGSSSSLDMHQRIRVVESCGGRQIEVCRRQSSASSSVSTLDWQDILEALAKEGIKSVMVEGGARVINDLLASKNQHLVRSVIVTIAPTYLGQGGVVVSPDRTEKSRNEARLKDVKWMPLGQDVVMAGRLGG